MQIHSYTQHTDWDCILFHCQLITQDSIRLQPVIAAIRLQQIQTSIISVNNIFICRLASKIPLHRVWPNQLHTTIKLHTLDWERQSKYYLNSILTTLRNHSSVYLQFSLRIEIILLKFLSQSPSFSTQSCTPPKAFYFFPTK